MITFRKSNKNSLVGPALICEIGKKRPVYEGVEFKYKLQYSVSWLAAAWTPRRLCYRPTVFFRQVHVIELSCPQGKIWRACKNDQISFFYCLKIACLEVRNLKLHKSGPVYIYGLKLESEHLLLPGSEAFFPPRSSEAQEILRFRFYISFVLGVGYDLCFRVIAASITRQLFIPQIMYEYRALAEWYWQGNTEILEENPIPVPLCWPYTPSHTAQVAKHWPHPWQGGDRPPELQNGPCLLPYSWK
jgi:hypothetical protein